MTKQKTQTQTQKNQNESKNKLAALALIHAMASRNSFIIEYRDVYDAAVSLCSLGVVDDALCGDEEELDDALFETLHVDEEITKYAFKIYAHPDDSYNDLFVILPKAERSEKLTKAVEEIVKLLDFKLFHVIEAGGRRMVLYDDPDRADAELRLKTVYTIIDNIVRMKLSSCTEHYSPARIALEMASEFKLVEAIDGKINRYYTGTVEYAITGGVKIIKHLFYCNDCVNVSTGQNFIEKCVDYSFLV